MAEPGFTVQLERLFQGPMDLLLHLVREQEVDIRDVEINTVIDRYLDHLRDLAQIDIELAGEFVVMAATLMAIKARSLLPGEEIDLETELDPRDELIARLIEYRKFKESAQDLGQRFELRQRCHARADVRAQLAEREPASFDLSELSAWDLLATYSRLMRETLRDQKMRIESDERPMRFYVEQLVSWIRAERRLKLHELVERARPTGRRHQLVGSFCALLELVRLGVVGVRQSGPEVSIELRTEHEADIEEIVRASGFDDEHLGELGLGQAEAGNN
jgi:segregation and condensation protein A